MISVTKKECQNDLSDLSDLNVIFLRSYDMSSQVSPTDL